MRCRMKFSMEGFGVSDQLAKLFNKNVDNNFVECYRRAYERRTAGS